MIYTVLNITVAALLVWSVLLLIPMIPGKLIDTRNFSELPRWRYNLFNVFLTSLGIASFIIAGFALWGAHWIFAPALLLSFLYMGVCALDLFEVFPVVKDKLPVQLLILEAILFASNGVLGVIALAGIRLSSIHYE